MEVLMQDEAIPIDPIAYYRFLGPAMRVYWWFALVAVIVALTRLAKSWIAVLPVMLKRRAGSPALLSQLQTARCRFQQWIVAMLLGGGLTFAIELYTISTRPPVPPNIDEVRVGVGQMTAVVLGLTFSIALLLFLIQWHLLNRIEYLRSLNDSSAR